MKKSLLAAVAATASMLLTAPAAGAMTYTLEPTDFDGVLGIVMNVTQQQLGGTLCPCTKIPYPADVVSNAQGVAALASTPLKAGDIVLGYSLGSVVISAYLNSHTPPPGVKFILLGDTSNPYGFLAAAGLLPLFGGGIPPDHRSPRPLSHRTSDSVTIISRQYDGWADFPTNIFAPGYLLAVLNAINGTMTIHNDYTEASLLDNPANVTWRQGNITYELVPTQHLPLNQSWRNLGLDFVADWLDTMERPWIDRAYIRPSPTPAQLAASTSEQAKIPSPVKVFGFPEPVARLNLPPSASVPASSTNQTPTLAPARAATNLVISASTVGDLTLAPRHRGISSGEAGSEVQTALGSSDAQLTTPLTTKPAAVSSRSEPSPHDKDDHDGVGVSAPTQPSDIGGKGQNHADGSDSGRHRNR